MKYTICTLMLAMGLAGHAQKITLYDVRQVFYADKDNYTMFYAVDDSCGAFRFETDNGTVRREGCRLKYMPNKPGNATLRAYILKNGKWSLYESLKVIVRANDLAEAAIGMRLGGKIGKEELYKTGGLSVKLWMTERHAESIRIKGFTMIFHKANGSILFAKMKGNIFSKQALQLISNLQPGEKVSVTNVEPHDSISYMRVNPIEFTIK